MTIFMQKISLNKISIGLFFLFFKKILCMWFIDVTSCKCHCIMCLRSQGRKRKKQWAITHRLISTGEIEDCWSRHWKCFHSNRTIDHQSKHVYNVTNKVSLSLTIKINFDEKKNFFFYSNPNELSIDQLQAILNNDHIRQHLIQVGYVSCFFLF